MHASLNLKRKIDMVNKNFLIYNVCLTFEKLICTHLNNQQGKLEYDPEMLSNFKFESTKSLNSESLPLWCNQKIDFELDGNLDNPDNFKAISKIRVFGPKFAEYNQQGLALDDLCVYIEIAALKNLDVDYFEDLFHLITPFIWHNNLKLSFADFASTSVYFKNTIDSIRNLDAKWN